MEQRHLKLSQLQTLEFILGLNMAIIRMIDKKGNILATSDSTAGSFRGICYLGQRYFAVIHSRNNTVYIIRVDFNRGTSLILIKTLIVFGGHGLHTPYGITFDGNYFYIVGTSTTIPTSGFLKKYSRDGKLIKSNQISGVAGDALNMRSVTFNGRYFYFTDITSDKIWVLNHDGKVIKKFDAPENKCQGITYDGYNFWVAGTNNDSLYYVDYEGNTKDTIGGYAFNVKGIATDGKHLYITQ